MATQWYRLFEGTPVGPFTVAEFRDLVAQDLVTAETQVRRSDMESWVAAGQVKGLLDPPPAEEPSPQAEPVSVERPPLETANTKEYKVLTQKDRWFSTKFDPARLEEALNAYAEQGWVVKAATTAAFTGLLSGNREELIVILER